MLFLYQSHGGQEDFQPIAHEVVYQGLLKRGSHAVIPKELSIHRYETEDENCPRRADIWTGLKYTVSRQCAPAGPAR